MTPLAPLGLASEEAADMAGVGRGLRRLRGAVSSSALLRLAADAICENVGFKRVALLRLRFHALVADSAHVLGEPEKGERLLAYLRSQTFPLRPRLHESEVLRRQRPLLVEDATSDPRALGAVPGTRAYVLAPVICQERPVALVHADRGLTGPEVTEWDRDVLSVFTEGLGYALERGLLTERLRSQSAQVLALARSTQASVTELGRPEIELLPANREASPSPGLAAPEPELSRELTRRELEVLGMLAEGETNARIAQRLVVSEGTVKTHVKHILRKLGVQNRSQAVSLYFRTRVTDSQPPAAAAAYRIG